MGSGARARARHIDWLPHTCTPNRAGNLQNEVRALYWESNPQHFGQQADALSTEKTGKGYLFLTLSGEGFLSMAAFTLPRNTCDNDVHPCPKISFGVA